MRSHGSGRDDDLADGLAVDEGAQRLAGPFQRVAARDVGPELARGHEVDQLVTDRPR